MTWLQQIAAWAGVALLNYGWIIALLLAFELLWPSAPQSLSGRLRGLSRLVVMALAAAAVGVAFRRGWSSLGVAPLFAGRIPIANATLRYAAETVAALLLVDFGFYWRHRLQHALAWRFHAVHHSIAEMNATTFYHHPTEELFHIAFTSLPLALLINEPSTALASALLSFQAVYLHSSTRLTLGPLRYVIGDNAFHRIHHSTDPAHHGKNFSAFFPLFDVLFGTAYFPKAGEWPQTGVAELPEPSTFKDYIFGPWRLSPTPQTSPAAAE